MTAKQVVFGPYQVKNIGVGGDIFEIVEMIDDLHNTWSELRPRKTYLNKRSAKNQCYRMNKRWQEENALG